MYDQYGADPGRRPDFAEQCGPQQFATGRHPFEADISPEELFNLFFNSGAAFGGALASSVGCESHHHLNCVQVLAWRSPSAPMAG